MKDVSEKDKGVLKRLRDEAYLRELNSALEALASSFDDWREERINGYQLSDTIHEFHNGAARKLSSIYHQLDERMAVASALARGVLNKDEVPEHLIVQLQIAIDFFEHESGD